MRLDDNVVLSPAGRQVIEQTLAGLLRDRRNARAQRSSGLRLAYNAEQMLLHSVDRLSSLCGDLGFESECEAERELLDRVEADQQAYAETPDEEERR